MAINVLIGVGGTGAKVVEAALYMLAAGLGPEKVVVGLVDQDNSNGNLARTTELIADLQTVRADWAENKQNRLDWTTSPKDGGTVFLRTEIESLFPANPHWRPASADKVDLASLLGSATMTKPEKALFDLLFRPGDDEQEMGLAQGYRGRAHIGSTALLASLELDETAFKDRILSLMNKSTGGDEVRIFLVGSVFGGTGAAGFPTLARAMHKMREPGADAADRKEVPNSAKVHIGGALMLPYFGFADPADRSANVVRARELLPQARVALEYYDRLISEERIFDRFYVAGWDSLFSLPYHSAGNAEQRNPALPPELLGALAAIDFLTGPAASRTAEPEVLVTARVKRDQLGWADIPAANAEARDRIYDRLGRLIRMAAYWTYSVEPAFDGRSLFGKTVLGKAAHAWMRDLTKETVWETGTPEARKNLVRFFRKLLTWSESMRLFADSAATSLGFDLWNAETLLARSDRGKPTDPVTLHDARSEPEMEAAYDKLLKPSDAAALPRNAKDLFDELNEGSKRASAGQNRALGKLVAAVHRAARPFHPEA